MKSREKKFLVLLFIALLFIMPVTGCGTTKLDNPNQKQEKSDDWMEEEKKEETKETEETEKETPASEEEEYLDVESAEDETVDYSKYEEKKETQKQQNGAVGGVTYSDGTDKEEDQYHTQPVPEGQQKPVEPGTVDIDKDKEYTCYIEEIGEEEILAHIMYVQEAGYELSSKIYLFQGLPKSDKMELIIQKAVELGVHQVIPVASKRAVVKLDKKKEEKKITRWQAISESAAKQSKRMYVPEITNVMSFQQAVDYAGKLDIVLFPYELADGMKKTKEIIGKIKPGQSVGIFIGPEGGFEESEVALAKEKADAQVITLGKRILRTETAGLTVLAILMYTLEE